MYTSKEIIAFVREQVEKMNIKATPAGLYDPIRYVLSMGGKRLRPVLMLMAYNLYREDLERIVPLALGLETYHNYTLLHDDLMDHADMRRGHLTVHKKWNENTAILSGDSMLVLAYSMMQQAPAEHLAAVLDLFTRTALEIGEGQQYDIDFEERNDVTEDEYIEMIRLKTSVLLACALKIGALTGGAEAKDSDLLYQFGEKVGLAFQLQDDYLDVYGDPEKFGKKIGGDILCNKKTYMLIKAFELADEEQRRILKSWIDCKSYVEEEKISSVRAIYDAVGVPGCCNEKINAYFEEALQLLEKVALPEEKKEGLKQFVLTLLDRDV
ncbi:polyprenyl synthetase family protein [Bacteroides sp. OF04-15BH]|uniref:polyprenyl synthetase family protein n=1 Tax=Bacteroides sp. OF04-15BH TaxID=2292281 RepID=UPI000E480540|nr:polyprenyl synthetase family protein [Bacteroides sp. OF04-15BH]